MPKGRETALGRVRRLAPHRGYAAIKRYVRLPPVHGRKRATRMHGIVFRQVGCCLQPLIRISPISHTRLAAFHSEKISAEPQKEAAQKDERNAPILIKTKHRVVATFAELLKNWGVALMTVSLSNDKLKRKWNLSFDLILWKIYPQKTMKFAEQQCFGIFSFHLQGAQNAQIPFFIRYGLCYMAGKQGLDYFY